MTEDVETAVFDVGNLVPDDFEKSMLEEEEDNAGDTGEQLATLSLQLSLLTVSALPTGKRIKVVHSVLSVETRDGTIKGPLLTFILKFCTRPYLTGIHPIHAFLLTAVLGDEYAFKSRCSLLLHYIGFLNDTLIVKALGVSFHSASPDRENSQGFFIIFDTNYSGRKCRDGLKNVSAVVKHPPHNKNLL
jgi:hypothetical protein